MYTSGPTHCNVTKGQARRHNHAMFKCGLWTPCRVGLSPLASSRAYMGLMSENNKSKTLARGSEGLAPAARQPANQAPILSMLQLGLGRKLTSQGRAFLGALGMSDPSVWSGDRLEFRPDAQGRDLRRDRQCPPPLSTWPSSFHAFVDDLKQIQLPVFRMPCNS